MVVSQLEVKLEPLTINDLEACWKLDRQCFPSSEAYDKDTIKYFLCEKKRVCYKIVDQTNAMIGFIIGLADDDQTGHIMTLAVSAESRKKGYGQRLIQRLEEGFRLQDVAIVHLEVRVSNKQAQHLYTKQGYVIVERLESYYPDSEDAFLMIKSLLDVSPEVYE
jgi:ribosomal-protein-alanine N-acetyltransferase